MARVTGIRQREKEDDVAAARAATATTAIPVFHDKRILVDARESGIDRAIAPTESFAFDNTSTDLGRISRERAQVP